MKFGYRHSFAALAAALLATGASGRPAPADDVAVEADAAARAASAVTAMTTDEKLSLVMGIIPAPLKGVKVPPEAVTSVGFVPGVPRLGVPPLTETDGPLGISYLQGARKDGATPMPSGPAMASTWNPDLLYRVGATMGAEARAKGFNVLLAGAVNLVREPRNGRTYEYLGEDPLLAGTLIGASISGIQSNHVISTIKHFALNDQETGRGYLDVKISEAEARESDLLAIQIGLERGSPGAVMCSYNKINGVHACENDWLLNKVLKQDWGFKGFVMSDWGAVHNTSSALHGLDQQSGAQLDDAFHFREPLRDAVRSDPAYAARLNDMARRILTAIYARGLDKYPVKPGGDVDWKAHALVAEEAAKQGIVLLRNERGVLPLARTAKRIAVIGGNADVGVLSGAGGSQVHEKEGPALAIARGGDGPRARINSEQYHRSSPLKAIRALAPQAVVSYRDGRYVSDAVAIAKSAEVAIVFANEWRVEGADVPDLTLPDRQNELIAAVAAANANTIVVLQTGGPVEMPWLGQTAAVVEAWYPGMRGGEAIASLLFGETNFSGRLPLSFPASLSQLPRPVLDGRTGNETGNIAADRAPETPLVVDYSVEGSDVGYRWFARQGQKPLFPFGFGLSYTDFSTDSLKISGLTATVNVHNVGQREGATVLQLYLTARDGQVRRRLVGYQRVTLQAGASQTVKLPLDRRVLADWENGKWSIRGGRYSFAIGENAESLGPDKTVTLQPMRWTDR